MNHCADADDLTLFRSPCRESHGNQLVNDPLLSVSVIVDRIGREGVLFLSGIQPAWRSAPFPVQLTAALNNMKADVRLYEGLMGVRGGKRESCIT